MPSTNTWTATGYPGSAGYRSPTATGRERVWNNTPHFGALPKDEKPVNGYSDVQYRISQTSLYSRTLTSIGNPPSYMEGPGCRFDNGGITGGIDSLVDTHFNRTTVKANQLNSTIVKALVKMADAKTNVAVAFAEASKTSDLILDTARRIDRAYRAFRKGNLKGVAQNLNITPRRLHKSWLEYKYGWMPLLMDVKGSAEFFAQQVGELRKPRFTVSAKEQSTSSKPYVISTATYGGGSPHNINVFLSGHVETRVKIWCELSSPHYSEMQQLGLTNPALIAWELVPFSFVFDWFIQVGDYLTAISSHHGVTIRRAMFNQIESDGYTASEPATSASDLAYVYGTTASDWAGTRRRYVRSIPDLHPFSLYPPVTNSFDFPKLVTSLALIQGTYRGNSRTARI